MTILVSWLALLALLGLTVLVAYQPLGALNTVVALLVAALKALIIATVFMELRERPGLTVAFAMAGFFLARHSALARGGGFRNPTRVSARDAPVGDRRCRLRAVPDRLFGLHSQIPQGVDRRQLRNVLRYRPMPRDLCSHQSQAPQAAKVVSAYPRLWAA